MSEPFTDDELSRIKHETYQAFGEHIRVRADVFQRVLTELQEARTEKARLREALAWYADEDNWRPHPHEENYRFRPSETMYDMGEGARQALKWGE